MRLFLALTSIMSAALFGNALASVEACAFETQAKQAYAIDYDTGTVLFSKNAQEKAPTSSMSKVLTLSKIT